MESNSEILINRIEKFDLTVLLDIVTFLLDNKENLEMLENDIGIKTGNNGYGSIFIKPFNPLFETIILVIKDNKLISIFFYCNIQFSLEDLHKKFKTYREAYSFKDDLYYYFFNEAPNSLYSIYCISIQKIEKVYTDELQQIVINLN